MIRAVGKGRQRVEIRMVEMQEETDMQRQRKTQHTCSHPRMEKVPRERHLDPKERRDK